jgi:CubicO group peptidase (beta-lactamase class C family)
MLNTFVYSRAISKDYPIKVAGYNRSYRSFRPIDETLLDGIVGDKGVYSTTIDLLAWDQALYSERLVSKATIEEAYSPTKLANGREMPYGFGFRLKNENNKCVIYHHGRWEGFRNVFERYIDDKYTIILLNHTSFNGISRLSDHLIQSLFEPAYNSLTEDMVMAALHNGVKSAMKEYHDRKIKDPAINIDLVKVLEAVNYLDELNKHNLARKIKQLYFAISDDIQSPQSGS